MKQLAIVLPAYNEAQSLPLVLQNLQSYAASHLDQLGVDLRYLVVNDGSKDDTTEVMRGVCQSNPAVQYISLSRNFGKEAAISAGLHYVQDFDAAIIMDADGQHPVAMLKPFIEQWLDGAQVVYGVQQDRKENPLKVLLKSWFYRFLGWSAQIHIPENAGDFRLLDKKAVAALNAMPERSRYMKGLYAWVGFRAVALPFVASKRLAGESHYGWKKLLALGLDALTSFSVMPLRLVGLVGLLISLSSVIYASVLVYQYFANGVDVPGWTTLSAGMLFLSGIQLLGLGMIAEYLGRVFAEAKQRPLYLVDEALNTPPQPIIHAGALNSNYALLHTPAQPAIHAGALNSNYAAPQTPLQPSRFAE